MRMLGLKRGYVELVPHQDEWIKIAEDTINTLNGILGDIALDIQHIGSTAIYTISSKPIIDIAIGINDLDDISPYIKQLEEAGIIFRGEDLKGQLLFVIGDFEKDTRTHHIHVVKWNGIEWNNYIDFRDYLNEFPEKAMIYDNCKQELVKSFSNDRKSYTRRKQEIIGKLLAEAKAWREKQLFESL